MGMKRFRGIQRESVELQAFNLSAVHFLPLTSASHSFSPLSDKTGGSCVVKPVVRVTRAMMSSSGQHDFLL